MMSEHRPLRPLEVAVIRATLQRAAVCPVTEDAIASISRLSVVARCECGCASVSLEKEIGEEPLRPMGDGIGTTPTGGQVGVIVWGGEDAVTGLEVYDLGAGQGGLVLPVPDSIMPFREQGIGNRRGHPL